MSHVISMITNSNSYTVKKLLKHITIYTEERGPNGKMDIILEGFRWLGADGDWYHNNCQFSRPASGPWTAWYSCIGCDCHLQQQGQNSSGLFLNKKH